MNHAYPQWMNGDQLCAEAERRADEDAVIESIEDQAYWLVQEWLDKDDPEFVLPNGQTLADMLALLLDEHWTAIANDLALRAIANADRTYGSPSLYGATRARKQLADALTPLAVETVTKDRQERAQARMLDCCEYT